MYDISDGFKSSPYKDCQKSFIVCTFHNFHNSNLFQIYMKSIENSIFMRIIMNSKVKETRGKSGLQATKETKVFWSKLWKVKVNYALFTRSEILTSANNFTNKKVVCSNIDDFKSNVSRS